MDTVTYLATKIQFVAGTPTEEIKYGQDDKAYVQLTYPIPSIANRLEFDALVVVKNVIDAYLFELMQTTIPKVDCALYRQIPIPFLPNPYNLIFTYSD